MLSFKWRKSRSSGLMLPTDPGSLEVGGGMRERGHVAGPSLPAALPGSAGVFLSVQPVESGCCLRPRYSCLCLLVR